MRVIFEQFASINIENHQRATMEDFLGHPIILLDQIKKMSRSMLD